MKKLALVVGILALAVGAAQAATMTEGVFHIVGGSTFNVSVFPGNEGFAGVGAGGAVDELFNNPVLDYRFFTDGGSNNVAATYANGAPDLISDVSVVFPTGYFGSPDNAKVWETTDPGTGYSSTPDYATNTMIGNTTTVAGTVDISGLTEGSLYFFYGAYRSTPDIDFVMSDTDGGMPDIILNDVGDNDYANGNEFYACSVDFVNDAGYDTISYVHTNPRVTGNGGSGRHMGTVLTAPADAVPEPATVALLGLGALGLVIRRR